MTLRAFVILAAALATGVSTACNSPPAAPPSASASTSTSAPASATAPAAASATAATSATATASASATGAASASGPALPKGKCSGDADCRLRSSYCTDAPCACMVLGKDDADLKCRGGQVSCFADPCMKKAARCDAGKCVLSTAGATDK